MALIAVTVALTTANALQQAFLTPAAALVLLRRQGPLQGHASTQGGNGSSSGSTSSSGSGSMHEFSNGSGTGRGMENKPAHQHSMCQHCLSAGELACCSNGNSMFQPALPCSSCLSGQLGMLHVCSALNGPALVPHLANPEVINSLPAFSWCYVHTCHHSMPHMVLRSMFAHISQVHKPTHVCVSANIFMHSRR